MKETTKEKKQVIALFILSGMVIGSVVCGFVGTIRWAIGLFVAAMLQFPLRWAFPKWAHEWFDDPKGSKEVPDVCRYCGREILTDSQGNDFHGGYAVPSLVNQEQG